MAWLHKFNLKRSCFYLIAIIFCLAITFTTTATGAHKKDIYSKLTGKKISTAWFQILNPASSDTIPADTIPKKTVNNSKSLLSNRADTLPTKSKITSPVNSINRSNISNSFDTLPRNDTGLVQMVDTFSLKLSKDSLDAPVAYEAEDSAVLFVKDQRFLLYGKTRTTHKDIILTAPHVELNQKTNILTAYSSKDSLGNVITRASFEQGPQKFQSDSIQFNFKTQRGVTKNTYTQEGEFFIKAGTAKKVNATTMFVKEGYYTTCNFDDPHFAFKSNKLKIINSKLAVSGPTHPEFEGVPVPIYLPFGIYPLTQTRHSGLLPPQFTATEQFGLGLEGLGYYHVLNEYLDVTLRGNIYSYGGWSANLTPSYRKRYRYQGSFNLALQHTKFAFKGDPDFNLVKTFAVTWSHSVDQRARPGTSFSASVNVSSTKHNQYIPNNPYRNFVNQQYSSVSYSKQWQGKPYSLQLSANHNQNNSTKLIYLTLPDAGFTVSTLYPFQRKELVGNARWYEKIGVGYSGVARNQVAFYDTGSLQFKKILDTLQWGARHSFPINLQLPPLGGKFFISPSVSYEETWLTHRLGRQWNNTLKKIDTVLNKKGLFIDRQMSFGMSMNTNVFGTFRFKKSRIIAIRHVMRPSFGMSYKPNLSKRFYDVIQVDALGNTQAIPQFGNNLFNGYGFGRFGGMNFGLDNNLEMKWRSKKDTGTSAIKKIRLIDGFGVSSSYNFLRDSLRLEPFNLYLRSTLFEKLSLTAQAILDPYEMGPTGLSINRFVWNGDKFSLGNIRYGSISMSTNFQSKPRDAGKAAITERSQKITDPNLLNDQQSLEAYRQRNPAEFVDFNIPWSINLSYSLTFSKRPNATFTGFDTDLSSNISFTNSFSLTPKWNFSTNGFFDIDTKKLTMFTMSISRDMHCWQMSINTTPIGQYRFFNITISPKSSVLQNLKINRTRYFYNY